MRQETERGRSVDEVVMRDGGAIILLQIPVRTERNNLI